MVYDSDWTVSKTQQNEITKGSNNDQTVSKIQQYERRKGYGND